MGAALPRPAWVCKAVAAAALRRPASRAPLFCPPFASPPAVLPCLQVCAGGGGSFVVINQKGIDPGSLDLLAKEGILALR